MARGCGSVGGKIGWLLDQIDEHQGPVRAELVRAGLSLDDAGTGRSTWGNIVAVLEAAEPGSPFVVAVEGDSGALTFETELMMFIIDQLNVLMWQGAGSPKGKRPRRIPRPGEQTSQQVIGAGESWTPESFDEWVRLVEEGYSES